MFVYLRRCFVTFVILCSWTSDLEILLRAGRITAIFHWSGSKSTTALLSNSSARELISSTALIVRVSWREGSLGWRYCRSRRVSSLAFSSLTPAAMSSQYFSAWAQSCAFSTKSCNPLSWFPNLPSKTACSKNKSVSFSCCSKNWVLRLFEVRTSLERAFLLSPFSSPLSIATRARASCEEVNCQSYLRLSTKWPVVIDHLT